MKKNPSLINEKPRERLRRHGAEALSNSELLAILFNVGTRHHSVLKLAESVLIKAGSLSQLFGISAHELMQHPGLGFAKYCQLQAAYELTQRCYYEKITHPASLRNGHNVAEWLRIKLKRYQHEVFVALYLNTQYQLIQFEILFEGTLDHTAVYPRQIAKRCLEHNAAALIVAHNHPSGNSTPSHADIKLTAQLKKALALIDVKLLDHLVVTGHEVQSIAL